MNEEAVWLYKVLNVEDMTNEQLQIELDNWSKYPMPNELIHQKDKLIIKYQSTLTHKAYFNELSNTYRSATD